ncbi:hypothetical protein HDU98_007249 [Podochytrium sp. JEL0797]|nr:hypothetical protein HDU98_007249 [Podochytrium sp. JEL0797]
MDNEIESTRYLFTNPLLRGPSRTHLFPVSACLPSAGGGVFRTPLTPSESRAVFVKTSRDACDGRTWNAGILQEDEGVKRARIESVRRKQQRAADVAAAGGKAGKDPLRAKLAGVYRKHHLEDVLGALELRDGDGEVGEEGGRRGEARFVSRERTGGKMSVGMVESTALAMSSGTMKPPPPPHAASVSPHRVKEYHPGSNHPPSSVGAISRTRPGGADFAQQLMNDPSASSIELLSCLTGSNVGHCPLPLHPGANPSSAYKCITSLGTGLPASRPESGAPRGWDTVKTQLMSRSSASRRTSWADLNRDTEYIKKYDVNAIPGLEVRTSRGK